MGGSNTTVVCRVFFVHGVRGACAGIGSARSLITAVGRLFLSVGWSIKPAGAGLSLRRRSGHCAPRSGNIDRLEV